MDLAEQIRELIEPEIRLYGAELLDLQLRGKPGRYRLYVIADTVDGITIAQCTEITRRILNLPELDDLLGSNFVLEVSSPGVDWPLRTRREFELKLGRELEVTYREEDQEKKIRGELMAADDEAILVRAPGKSEDVLRIFYSQIVKAVQALPW
ncbi:MAG TPA: hypothetical protein ENJ23_02360 [Bacteroidetes bacterium]|nr:hypothetical protein [Bacteroidota bacterium]